MYSIPVLMSCERQPHERRRQCRTKTAHHAIQSHDNRRDNLTTISHHAIQKHLYGKYPSPRFGGTERISAMFGYGSECPKSRKHNVT